MTSSAFKPGAHLQVRRPLGYNHHGIYISDERVIQFGGGIFDKPHAAIEAVSLECFERGGTAKAVRHGRHTWFTVYLPAADPPEKIIARAEFLLANYLRRRYNLIGNNCEHMANCCVAGGYTESHQIRGYFAARVVVGAGVNFYVAGLSRAKRPLSTPGIIAVGVFILTGIAPIVIYNLQIRRFWLDVGDKWRAHERAIATTQPPAADE